eukprot:CAMPEP_0113940836 /NCGR_PEP_ID=MMETSP1339-20121228/6884_1 /TAXON_ID=94617 /ORGANISM="Fibrocapsa japonica" /LENGTH=892 /DNA_ID=CAMNT_0000944797 /DNA_START=215 /DNA_END=2893 /DNA_ORIENTATION=+ /assembly_acc=CAM_ASM_000762
MKMTISSERDISLTREELSKLKKDQLQDLYLERTGEKAKSKMLKGDLVEALWAQEASAGGAEDAGEADAAASGPAAAAEAEADEGDSSTTPATARPPMKIVLVGLDEAIVERQAARLAQELGGVPMACFIRPPAVVTGEESVTSAVSEAMVATGGVIQSASQSSLVSVMAGERCYSMGLLTREATEEGAEDTTTGDTGDGSTSTTTTNSSKNNQWHDAVDVSDFVVALYTSPDGSEAREVEARAIRALEERCYDKVIEVDASDSQDNEQSEAEGSGPCKLTDLVLSMIDMMSLDFAEPEGEEENSSQTPVAVEEAKEVVEAAKLRKRRAELSEEEEKARKEEARARSLAGALEKKAKKEAAKLRRQQQAEQAGGGAVAKSTNEEPYYMRLKTKTPRAPAAPLPIIPSRIQEVDAQSLKAMREQVEPLEFGPLTLRSSMAAALRQAGITTPSPIQANAMTAIRQGSNAVVHAETGSGKTLAYLLPLLMDMDWSTPRQLLVVAPGRELAVQIGREMVVLLGGRADLVELVLEGKPKTVQGGNQREKNLASGHPALRTQAPIVVATARQMEIALKTSKKFEEHKTNFLKSIKTVVLDEVDRLIDPLPKYATLKERRQRELHPRPASTLLYNLFLSRISGEAAALPKVQLVACSATVGRQLTRELCRLTGMMPRDLPVLRGSDADSLSLGDGDGEDPEGGGAEKTLRYVNVPPSIKHFYIPTMKESLEEKMEELLVAITMLKPRAPLLFIPRDAKISGVIEELHSVGLTEAQALHQAMGFGSGHETSNRRHEGKSAMLSLDHIASLFQKKSEDERPPLLVASEDTARGLHFNEVDYVFLLAKPKTPDEYLHLAGRTGRQGKEGNVVTVISFREVKKMKAWKKILGVELEELELNML